MPDWYVHIYVVYLPSVPLLYCEALIEIIGGPDVSKNLKLSITFISAVGCQNSSVWDMFWILYPCRNLQH